MQGFSPGSPRPGEPAALIGHQRRAVGSGMEAERQAQEELLPVETRQSSPGRSLRRVTLSLR